MPANYFKSVVVVAAATLTILPAVPAAPLGLKNIPANRCTRVETLGHVDEPGESPSERKRPDLVVGVNICPKKLLEGGPPTEVEDGGVALIPRGLLVSRSDVSNTHAFSRGGHDDNDDHEDSDDDDQNLDSHDPETVSRRLDATDARSQIILAVQHNKALLPQANDSAELVAEKKMIRVGLSTLMALDKAPVNATNTKADMMLAVQLNKYLQPQANDSAELVAVKGICQGLIVSAALDKEPVHKRFDLLAEDPQHVDPEVLFAHDELNATNVKDKMIFATQHNKYLHPHANDSAEIMAKREKLRQDIVTALNDTSSMDVMDGHLGHLCTHLDLLSVAKGILPRRLESRKFNHTGEPKQWEKYKNETCVKQWENKYPILKISDEDDDQVIRRKKNSLYALLSRDYDRVRKDEKTPLELSRRNLPPHLHLPVFPVPLREHKASSKQNDKPESSKQRRDDPIGDLLKAEKGGIDYEHPDTPEEAKLKATADKLFGSTSFDAADAKSKSLDEHRAGRKAQKSAWEPAVAPFHDHTLVKRRRWRLETLNKPELSSDEVPAKGSAADEDYEDYEDYDYDDEKARLYREKLRQQGRPRKGDLYAWGHGKKAWKEAFSKRDDKNTQAGESRDLLDFGNSEDRPDLESTYDKDVGESSDDDDKARESRKELRLKSRPEKGHTWAWGLGKEAYENASDKRDNKNIRGLESRDRTDLGKDLDIIDIQNEELAHAEDTDPHRHHHDHNEIHHHMLHHHQHHRQKHQYDENDEVLTKRDADDDGDDDDDDKFAQSKDRVATKADPSKVWAWGKGKGHDHHGEKDQIRRDDDDQDVKLAQSKDGVFARVDSSKVWTWGDKGHHEHKDHNDDDQADDADKYQVKRDEDADVREIETAAAIPTKADPSKVWAWGNKGHYKHKHHDFHEQADVADKDLVKRDDDDEDATAIPTKADPSRVWAWGNKDQYKHKYHIHEIQADKAENDLVKRNDDEEGDEKFAAIPTKADPPKAWAWGNDDDELKDEVSTEAEPRKLWAWGNNVHLNDNEEDDIEEMAKFAAIPTKADPSQVWAWAEQKNHTSIFDLDPNEHKTGFPHLGFLREDWNWKRDAGDDDDDELAQGMNGFPKSQKPDDSKVWARGVDKIGAREARQRLHSHYDYLEEMEKKEVEKEKKEEQHKRQDNDQAELDDDDDDELAKRGDESNEASEPSEALSVKLDKRRFGLGGLIRLGRLRRPGRLGRHHHHHHQRHGTHKKGQRPHMLHPHHKHHNHHKDTWDNLDGIPIDKFPVDKKGKTPHKPDRNDKHHEQKKDDQKKGDQRQDVQRPDVQKPDVQKKDDQKKDDQGNGKGLPVDGLPVNAQGPDTLDSNDKHQDEKKADQENIKGLPDTLDPNDEPNDPQKKKMRGRLKGLGTSMDNKLPYARGRDKLNPNDKHQGEKKDDQENVKGLPVDGLPADAQGADTLDKSTDPQKKTMGERLKSAGGTVAKTLPYAMGGPGMGMGYGPGMGMGMGPGMLGSIGSLGSGLGLGSDKAAEEDMAVDPEMAAAGPDMAAYGPEMAAAGGPDMAVVGPDMAMATEAEAAAPPPPRPPPNPLKEEVKPMPQPPPPPTKQQKRQDNDHAPVIQANPNKAFVSGMGPFPPRKWRHQVQGSSNKADDKKDDAKKNNLSPRNDYSLAEYVDDDANLDPEETLAPAADDSVVEAVAKAKAQRVVDHLEGHTVGALERVLGRVVG
jgi:hypothetical protein